MVAGFVRINTGLDKLDIRRRLAVLVQFDVPRLKLLYLALLQPCLQRRQRAQIRNAVVEAVRARDYLSEPIHASRRPPGPGSSRCCNYL